MTRVCLVTCYFDPDYVRSRALRAGLSANDDIELIDIKNHHRGLMRYPEVLLRILWTRLRVRPDMYLLAFRGQEVLPFLLILAWPKPVVFDEFIVPLAWATQEGHRKTARTQLFKILAQASSPFYRFWLRSCKYILTDTEIHARVSAHISRVPYEKYRVIPVGTDETLFKPLPRKQKSNGTFQVFFYGLKMTPLHGLQYILAAAEVLGEDPAITLTIIGGDDSTEEAVRLANANGAHVAYKKFVPFAELPKIIAESDLCLGGPFGNTPQARQVITGKTYQFIAMGVPTILGEVDEVTKFVDGENCLVVPQADAKALARKVAWARSHPEKLKKIGMAGRKTYEEYYSNAVISKTLREIV